MEQIGLFEAKNRFSKLVDRVSRGETIIITKNGHPLARLVPLETDTGMRPTRDDVLATFADIRSRAKLCSAKEIKQMIEAGRM